MQAGWLAEEIPLAREAVAFLKETSKFVAPEQGGDTTTPYPFEKSQNPVTSRVGNGFC